MEEFLKTAFRSIRFRLIHLFAFTTIIAVLFALVPLPALFILGMLLLFGFSVGLALLPVALMGIDDDEEENNTPE